MNIVTAILSLLGGLGVTLFGMHTMSESLETAAGDKLAKLFGKISNKRIPGLLIGTGVTAVVQSSGATTIMVVGFVNAGVMTLFQAASVIMGANIGTTITAQIAALSAFKINPWLGLSAFIGILLMMSKKPNIKNLGFTMIGIGLIFIGLELMSGSMKEFRSNTAFTDMLKNTKSPILLVFIGLFLTAALQSSSAVSVILITMATGGLITVEFAAFAILGANIGSCISAVMASFGANVNAKRATFIHITFNIIGVLIFYPIVRYSNIMPALETAFKQPATTIAMFHTIFNVSTALFLLFFTNPLCKLSELAIKDKKKEKAVDPYELKFSYVDSRLLNNTSIAISQIREEIISMGKLANDNLNDSIDAILNTTLENKETFEKRENKINFLNRQLAKTLVKLNSSDLNMKDKKMIGTLYHVISDIERVGDYAENLIEYTEKMISLKIKFSPDAQNDVKEMYFHIQELYKYVMLSFEQQKLEYLDIINREEDLVDTYHANLDDKHIERLNANQCSPENGAIFLSLISNLERIADHMRNIAISLKDYIK